MIKLINNNSIIIIFDFVLKKNELKINSHNLSIKLASKGTSTGNPLRFLIPPTILAHFVLTSTGLP